MSKPGLIIPAAIAAAVFAGTGVVNAERPQAEKSTGVVTPTPAADKAEREKKQAAATEAAKQLLLVMDTSKTGKVSKEEWMKFMESEFDRLDTNHTGELDVKELTQSRMRFHPAIGK
jgi:uncharacterized membrane protein YdfJ with MMPL/SSD domain